MRSRPGKLILPRDLRNRSQRSEHRKMKLLICAVIARAKEKGEWDASNGAWDVGHAVRLFDSVKEFFEYPSLTSTRRNDQISWRTVYNLFGTSLLPNERGRGRGRRRRRDLNEGGTESGGEEE